mgnify:CR=1 FL=1
MAVASCACGQLTAEVTGAALRVSVCHCTECQRQSGAAFGMSVMLAAGTLGRALSSIPATRVYTRYGMAWPAAMCAVLAVLTALGLRLVAALRTR